MRALIVTAAGRGVAPPAVSGQAAPTSFQDVVISGVMRDSDRGSYRELPFDVPAGVTKLTIDVEGADRKDGTHLVLGVYDPTR